MFEQLAYISFICQSQISPMHLQENKALFGGKTDVGMSKTGTHDAHTSLLQENKKHGLSLTLQRSHSSVFHAGVIGEGLRREGKRHVFSQVGVFFG